MRKEHDLESWVMYADLIKAFDSIHHELLFRILEKSGIPLSLIKVITKLYHKFKIEICVGKSKAEIDYAVGVKQGDNLAPILFIIVIQFLAELLEKKWSQHGIKRAEFCQSSNLYNKGGSLIRHSSNHSYLTKDSLSLILYVDDGAFVFNNKKDLESGSLIAFTQMKRLGLTCT